MFSAVARLIFLSSMKGEGQLGMWLCPVSEPFEFKRRPRWKRIIRAPWYWLQSVYRLRNVDAWEALKLATALTRLLVSP